MTEEFNEVDRIKALAAARKKKVAPSFKTDINKLVDRYIRALYAGADSQKLEKIENSIKVCGDVISQTRGDALELLKAKLEMLEEKQDIMKAENAQARKEMKRPPYERFELANNNASISRIRKRIANITALKASGVKTYTGTLSTGDDYTVTKDGESLYIYFTFDGRPSEETRSLLKENGFRWSPRNVRWQRKITSEAIRVTRLLISGK